MVWKSTIFYAGPLFWASTQSKEHSRSCRKFLPAPGYRFLKSRIENKEFVAVSDEARALIKELLDVPAGYEVVFLGGGASLQFCMVPFNLLNKKRLI